MTIRTWLPVLVGALIGLPLALYYTWVVDPVEYVQTAPGSLREDYRQTYLALIAQAYESTGDFDRAASRLELFEWQDMSAELAALAQRESASGSSTRRAAALAALASQLGADAGLVEGTPTPRLTPSAGPSALSPSPSARRSATATRRSTRIPTEVEPRSLSFELAGRQDVCQEPGDSPQLMIEVLDQDGDPLPAVELIVLWDDGQDRFFTGLKPEISPGYADFTMQSGVRYAVQVAGSGLLDDNVSTHLCRWENGQYPGSVSLIIEREGEQD